MCNILQGSSAYSEIDTLSGEANKGKKGLPLETKNTQNHENWRLGLIESLHMQHCSLRGCIRKSVNIVFDPLLERDHL